MTPTAPLALPFRISSRDASMEWSGGTTTQRSLPADLDHTSAIQSL